MNPAQNLLALWPASASADAVQTDLLILAFTLVTLFLTVPIFLSITYFALRYRKGVAADRSHREGRNVKIELSWMIIPFVLTLIFFVWAAQLFLKHRHPPADAMVIEAIGRQWMWKFQYPGGQSEINNLHVPTGENVRINLNSQDVIHSLYLPALRLQMEAVPGMQTSMWFNADRPGTYRLFCSEYCGTDHSVMDGTITIMDPAAYQAWLASAGGGQSLAAAGKQLFFAYGCSGCHGPASTARAPSLAGLYGRPVPLESGGTIIADDAYIRDKILMPNNNKIAGYKQIMPVFKNVMREEDLLRLVAYVKSYGQTVGATP